MLTVVSPGAFNIAGRLIILAGVAILRLSHVLLLFQKAICFLNSVAFSVVLQPGASALCDAHAENLPLPK